MTATTSQSPDPIGLVPSPETIALQLYTVRAPAADDFLGTLRRVAEIGYGAVEFAGYGGVPIPELRAALDEYGLRAMGAHVPLAAFEERLPEALAEVRHLGGAYAVVPSVPEARRADADAVRDLAAAFDRFGAACQAEGLAFAYHNHAFEFEPLPDDEGGRTLFDLLLQETDPALVGFELDLFWAASAGVDPEVLLHRCARRAPLVHLKDRPATGDRPDAPVGDGVLPWPQLLPAAAAAGTRWYIVEQDHPQDPFADVERSLRNLEAMTT